MHDLTLRQATPDDRGFAYRVKRAAFREYVEKVWGWDEEEQRRFHERRFAAQDFRVISVEGGDVGIMAVESAADCVRVKQLFILPEHQNRGIGTECMALVRDEARELGLAVRLQVLKVNPRAIAFYERLGFERTGRTDTHIVMERGP
jgi:GNAT superfamily N-acetyltransferase